ncbi:hypothetical protein [Streptomyces sp. S.PB5]|uniref:hypothetical protein n=1 Tax=Streptomyces sp. S.PB5 TaxID=3020844 RepID=UPI0025AFEB5B|nr:hypothetical protein [Streptomyces sp. S.PB5]MDN3020466.1 hypothetical protein [Streptomyces sp. S.PB5]
MGRRLAVTATSTTAGAVQFLAVVSFVSFVSFVIVVLGGVVVLLMDLLGPAAPTTPPTPMPTPPRRTATPDRLGHRLGSLTPVISSRIAALGPVAVRHIPVTVAMGHRQPAGPIGPIGRRPVPLIRRNRPHPLLHIRLLLGGNPRFGHLRGQVLG